MHRSAYSTRQGIWIRLRKRLELRELLWKGPKWISRLIEVSISKLQRKRVWIGDVVIHIAKWIKLTAHVGRLPNIRDNASKSSGSPLMIQKFYESPRSPTKLKNSGLNSDIKLVRPFSDQIEIRKPLQIPIE